LCFKTPPKRLSPDIADAIVTIEQFTSGMDVEDFRSNPMAVAAVERELQIVSEELEFIRQHQCGVRTPIGHRQVSSIFTNRTNNIPIQLPAGMQRLTISSSPTPTRHQTREIDSIPPSH